MSVRGVLRLPTPLHISPSLLGAVLEARIGPHIVDVTLPEARKRADSYELVGPRRGGYIDSEDEEVTWGIIGSWRPGGGLQSAAVSAFAIECRELPDANDRDSVPELLSQGANLWLGKFIPWLSLLSPPGPLPLGVYRSFEVPGSSLQVSSRTRDGQAVSSSMTTTVNIYERRRRPVAREVLHAAVHLASWHDEVPLLAELLERARRAFERDDYTGSVFESARAVEVASLALRESVGAARPKKSGLEKSLRWLQKEGLNATGKEIDELVDLRNRVAHRGAGANVVESQRAFDLARRAAALVCERERWLRCSCTEDARDVRPYLGPRGSAVGH